MSSELPSPWAAIIDQGSASLFEDELARELAAPHPLAGIPVSAVGKHAGNDDLLFALRDGSGRFAEVHLTWNAKPERPPWPVTTIYSSEAELIEQMLLSDQDAMDGS